MIGNHLNARVTGQFCRSQKISCGLLDFLPTDAIPMPTSLAEGRLPETFGWRSRVRPLRAWLVTTHSGGSGHRAGRHYDRSARCSLDGASSASRRSKRGPVMNGTGSRHQRENEDGIPEARPGAAAERELRQKCRGGAPRGAPASVIGRWSLAIQGSARTARRAKGCGVPHQRLSALRSPRFGERQKDRRRTPRRKE